MTDGGELDDLLDAILRASGSGLRNYTMQKTLGDMRAAVRKVYERGVTDGMEMSLYPGTPDEQRDAAARGREILAKAVAQANSESEATRLLLNVVADTLEDNHKSVLAAQLRQRFDLGDTRITPLAPGAFILHGKRSRDGAE